MALVWLHAGSLSAEMEDPHWKQGFGPNQHSSICVINWITPLQNQSERQKGCVGMNFVHSTTQANKKQQKDKVIKP